MIDIEVERTIPAQSERVWETLRSFEGIERFLPMIAASEVRGAGAGALRTCTTHDGGRLEERLEELDDDDMRLVYSILSGPLPVEDYRSTMQVRPAGADESVVTWSCSFRTGADGAEATRAAMVEVYESGLDGLAALFSRPEG